MESRGAFERSLRALIAPERGRPALPLAPALERVEAEHGVDFARARARAGFSRGHLIDVVLSLPGGRADEREDEAGDALLTLLLGEARAEDWLGRIDLVPAPRGGALAVLDGARSDERFFSIAELPAAFDRAIEGLYGGLPERPRWALGGEELWTLFELTPEPAIDYARKDDLLLATSSMPELQKCFLSGSPFASLRFSRAGELFAYLKFENREQDVKLAVSARRVLEDALDAALVAERAGRVVGSGVGVRYSYIDCALYAVERAVDVMAGVAGRVGLPERSWVLFCDSALAEQFAVLRPGAPAPPL